MLSGLNNAWTLYETGQLPEEEFVTMRGLFVSLLVSPGGQRWWELFKHLPPQYLVSHIDEAIRDADGKITPANESVPWLSAD